MTKFLATDDSSTYAQDKGKPEWVKTMIVKYVSLMKNKTWTLVPLPLRHKITSYKQVYNTKFTVDGQIKKYKGQLVEKVLINNKVLIIIKPLLQLLK